MPDKYSVSEEYYSLGAKLYSGAYKGFNTFILDNWGTFYNYPSKSKLLTKIDSTAYAEINCEDTIFDNNLADYLFNQPSSIGYLSSDQPLTTTYASTSATPSYDTFTKEINKINTELNSLKKEKEKEKNNMKANDLFNFDFGTVSSSQFRMSPYGIAVSTNSNGWVAYNKDTNEIFDVNIFNIDASKLIYKMPVALSAISVGDILIHNKKPVFVKEINSNGTVSVINYADATVVDILPVKNMFNFNYFTKVCALVDFSGEAATTENPFGNMLPFLMLSDNGNDFDPMMLLFMNKDNNVFQNPMMMYFLMSQKDNKSDFLPFLLMSNNNLFETKK